jgi:hypothetical protein
MGRRLYLPDMNTTPHATSSLILWFALAGLLGGVDTTAARAQANAPVTIVLDTDLGPDSDDAGALAMLHGLEIRGEARILGVACSTTNPWCAPCADAINTYYGRADIPVGTLKGPGSPGGSEEWYGDSFNGFVAGFFPNRIRHGSYAEDAVAMYRRLLAAEPDQSVVIAVVGAMTNLRDLLVSPPDETSPLPGRDLVARKVRLLSVMGGAYPSGSESNFTVDPGATQTLFEQWPGPVLFSGFEIGEDLLTGGGLPIEDKEVNPVVMSYHMWDLYYARKWEPDFDPESGVWPHSSFDQTAVLAAVRGVLDYWDVVDRGFNFVHADGTNEWRDTPDRDHGYLVEKMPREEVARVIEELMLISPASR